jgi:ABC-type antimicrobial peptide transport system permease subunit
MKTNVPLISSLRKPFRSLLLLILFGLISFGFITKAVGFILVQRETGVLGSYYRSIGVLENIKDPQAGDISAGIELIETSPYFAYGDQRDLVSGVMADTYNQDHLICNCPDVTKRFPNDYWPNVDATDMWFIGDLRKMEEVTIWSNKLKKTITIGYYLEFSIDTLFAAYPEDARQGDPRGFLFMFKGNESAIPLIEEMEVGQRYFIHGWKDWVSLDFDWVNTHEANLKIKPLDVGQPWYIPIAPGAKIDIGDPILAPFKNEIDVLNENLHTLGIIATADLSAMPKTQEASRFYYLTEGRWLNHQDDLDGNKVIVVPEEFARIRGFELGNEITLTFRPLTDTYYGLIRDGVDSLNWRSYPAYQEAFKIVGIYNHTSGYAYFAYIPSSSLQPGFTSVTQSQFNYENDYSFVLDSSRNENEFIQAYQVSLEELGISLAFLANNGPAYWAAVDPIRRSLSADIQVFGLLMVVALILAVFLYMMQSKRDYAILRALGVPKKQANRQLMLPLLLLGEIGILLGGFPAWNYALNQAKASLSSLPLPAGVFPSADLNPLFLAGLCAAIFLLLALFSWLGVIFLASKPVYELLQGQTSQNKAGQNRTRKSASDQPVPSLSTSLTATLDQAGSTQQVLAVSKADPAAQRKYNPASLSRYVIQHVLRSRLKSFLTIAIALGFMLASAWIRQTMERSQMEVDQLYDTTVVEADIVLADPSVKSNEGTTGVGSGIVYLKTIESVLNSDFVKSSILEADTTWFKIVKQDPQEAFPGYYPVYAYDSPETFYSGLADPGSIIFADGWDMQLFAEPRTPEEIQAEGVAALFPKSLLEQLQLNVGEKVKITSQSSTPYTCIIVGQYAGWLASNVNTIKTQRINSLGDSILIPLSVLEAMEGSQTKYTVAHFSLDPKKNRELPQLRAEMEKVMDVYGGKLRFIIWDEELRIVLAQLEKNISLLKVLYPVVIAVSVLIGAGLCFLLLLQATREAAILRVLGTTRTAVRLALILEPLFLSILGVTLGLGISRTLWMTSDLVPVVPLLTSAGLYLAGVLAGSVVGAISVTNKKPIELLQVKE